MKLEISQRLLTDIHPVIRMTAEFQQAIFKFPPLLNYHANSAAKPEAPIIAIQFSSSFNIVFSSYIKIRQGFKLAGCPLPAKAFGIFAVRQSRRVNAPVRDDKQPAMASNASS